MDVSYKEQFTKYVEEIGRLVRLKDGDALIELDSGASAEKIERASTKAGISIPEAIVDPLTAFSCRVAWDIYEFPEAFEGFDMVEFKWGIGTVLDSEKERLRVSQGGSRKKDQLCDSLWEKLFVFNGQGSSIHGYMAVDPALGVDSPVYRIVDKVGLAGHGAVIAENVESMFFHQMKLGFVFGDLAWEALTDGYTRPLDSDCPKAKKWLEWLRDE